MCVLQVLSLTAQQVSTWGSAKWSPQLAVFDGLVFTQPLCTGMNRTRDGCIPYSSVIGSDISMVSDFTAAWMLTWPHNDVYRIDAGVFEPVSGSCAMCRSHFGRVGSAWHACCASVATDPAADRGRRLALVPVTLAAVTFYD